MVQGPITLILTSLKVAPTHVERMITLQFRDQSLKRTVIHLQFTAWPELYVPRGGGPVWGAGEGGQGPGGSWYTCAGGRTQPTGSELPTLGGWAGLQVLS